MKKLLLLSFIVLLAPQFSFAENIPVESKKVALIDGHYYQAPVENNGTECNAFTGNDNKEKVHCVNSKQFAELCNKLVGWTGLGGRSFRSDMWGLGMFDSPREETLQL